MLSDAPTRCRLKPWRLRAGLTQRTLAERIGVSRQALIAIEQGRQVPSTQTALRLARALECRVEDLFELRDPDRVTAALAPGIPAARVVVGRVDGRWVAHPLHDPARPADGIVHGATPEGMAEVEPLAGTSLLERQVLVAGCAPLLGLLAGRLGRDEHATWIPAHSGRALELLERGLVHVAGIHLSAAEAPDGHGPLVRARFPDHDIAIVHLTRWRQGLLVSPDNPLDIRAVSDVARPDVRLVRRQPGSGAQLLLSEHLDPAVLSAAAGPLAAGHAEVADLIRWGVADTGVAIEATALSAGLGFVPIRNERFDLLVARRTLGHPPVRRLLDRLTARSFRAEAAQLAGYDLGDVGTMMAVQ